MENNGFPELMEQTQLNSFNLMFLQVAAAVFPLASLCGDILTSETGLMQRSISSTRAIDKVEKKKVFLGTQIPMSFIHFWQ